MPFLSVIEEHPEVKFSVHFTGFLLHWVEKHYPDIIEAMRRLSEKGQIELVTGGYYEPIFATIPDGDKVGQIEKLTRYLHNLFPESQQKISGMWLAERVWEPHLPRALSESGVEYVCLDDSHFKGVGVADEELLAMYVTEEQGHALKIFPINQQLRYDIPFAEPYKIIDYLRSIASESGTRGAFYFDDGEKFGIWPGTFDTVYTNGWLHRFFEALEANSDWIKLQTFGEYHRSFPPSGRVYLPTSSYMEMLEWSLPADKAALLQEARHAIDPRYATFLRGGYWRYFMVKYPEVNQLHKKMLHVSKQLAAMTATPKYAPQALEAARDKLWCAQSNDPYWHGIFGGLYLTNLRTANYQALIEAEAKLDFLEHENSHLHWLETETADVDMDGNDEVVVKTSVCNYQIAPAYGGAMYELDYKPRPFNLIDTLARRPEPYHDKLRSSALEKSGEHATGTIHENLHSKEAHLDKCLVYDWHRRLCFLDHFLAPSTTLDSMSRVQYGEQGDFINQPFKMESLVRQNNEAKLLLVRDGHVWVGETLVDVRLEKTYSFSGASETATVTYKIINKSSQPVDLWFAPELNLNFLAPDAPDRYYFSPDTGKRLPESALSSQVAMQSAQGIGIADEWLGLRAITAWSAAGQLWLYPIYTVSNSEAGIERLYQGSCLVPNWRINLSGGSHWAVDTTISVRGA